MSAPTLRLADGFPGERLTILPTAVIRRARVLPVCRDLCVTHLGRFDRVQGHYVDRPHGRPEHVLIVCLAGEGVVHLGRHHHRLQAGGGVILPPREPHRYAADPAAPWTIFWFHFIGRRAGDYVAALGLPRRRPVFQARHVEVAAEAFEDCYRHVLGGYTDGELLALSTAFARLLGLCRLYAQPANSRRREAEERVLRVVRYLREHADCTPTLDSLAREAGLSVPHFSVLFRRQMRCSPIEFHLRWRMQRACELLHSTDLTIRETAARLGYEDPLYFSRIFRRKVGVPPRVYRRSAQGAGSGRATAGPGGAR